MTKSKSVLPGIVEGYGTLVLSEKEISALIAVLEFAGNAAQIVLQQEAEHGRQASNSIKTYLADSLVLRQLILTLLEVGNPTEEEIN